MSSVEKSNTKVTIEDKESDIVNVSIKSDDTTFVTSVNHGVEEEGLDLGAIYKWSGIGIVTVVVFVVVLMYYAQYALNSAKSNVNVTSSYYEIEQLTQEADERLNSYGVIDSEEGIYRIPIDEAINKMATD